MQLTLINRMIRNKSLKPLNQQAREMTMHEAYRTESRRIEARDIEWKHESNQRYSWGTDL